jgi:sugar O-acyltransferase (sialic acid O-acetyltransferase NeuD family)
MKKLVIVGAGGFGREILAWIKDVPTPAKEYETICFLDDNPKALEPYNYQEPIIGGIQDYRPREGDALVMGIAAPTQRKLEIADSLLQRGARFISLIHPTAFLGNNVKLGQGCVICQNVIITSDVTIGNFVSINVLVAIGHDVLLGDGCTLYSFVNVNGFAKLGRGVEVGSHGTILPRAVVGDFAKVGAGSVVLKNVKPGSTVLGVPAKLILPGSA